MVEKLVRVMFVDAVTGAQIGRSELPVGQLPESFREQTTLELAGSTWSVERAEPPTAAEFAETGRLTMMLRRIETVSPADVLYSLPTICATLPTPTATPGDDHRSELHEDDWRQVEMVTADLATVVQTELDAVRRSYERYARRTEDGRVYGFQGIHVRTEPVRPLSVAVSRRRLSSLLGAGVVNRGGVGFRGQRGVVPSSFAMAVGPLLLYGLADGDAVAVLALHPDPNPRPGPAPAVATRLEQAMRSANLLLVDWCRGLLVAPASLGGYLTTTAVARG